MAITNFALMRTLAWRYTDYFCAKSDLPICYIYRNFEKQTQSDEKN